MRGELGGILSVCFMEGREGTPIIVDNNPDLNYEKISWWYYPLMVPAFLLLTFWVAVKKKILGPNLKINTFWFDGVSKNCQKIKENATRWSALDIVYNYQKGSENIFADFWIINIRNSQSTRNRLKLVKFLLLKNIEKISKQNKEVKIISIASGSAQGVIETIAQSKEKGILAKAVFLDLDPTALEYSRKFAQKKGVENQVTFINKTASFISEIGKEFKPNLIEMVGFLEYRPFDKAAKLIKMIYEVLEKEGIFLVSQITPNLESSFLKEVINWPMIYRKPKEAAKILFQAGFSPENCSFYFEPLKIHCMIECKKL